MERKGKPNGWGCCFICTFGRSKTKSGRIAEVCEFEDEKVKPEVSYCVDEIDGVMTGI